MKRIVVQVFPEPGGSATSAPPGSLRDDNRPDGDVPGDSAGDVKVEALLSDGQAQRLLAMLVEREPHGAAESMIDELLQGELALAGPDAQDLFERVIFGVERQLLSRVYAECDHIKTKAAARLGIDRNTLHKKLRQYNLIDAGHDETVAQPKRQKQLDGASRPSP